jgi:hypothetical protein
VRLISDPVCTLAVVSLLAFASLAQTPSAVGPNSDPFYQQLRNIGLGSEAISVSNFDLKRDAATFHLTSGTVCFVTPVNGKVTGAVFVGDGSLSLTPPTPDETRSLRRLTKQDEFREEFEHLALRFTDSTYDEIKKAGKPASGGCDAGLLQDSQHTTRKIMHTNISARILEDVLSDQPGGLFMAFIQGKHYDGKMLFKIDPVGPWDAVELSTYGVNKSDVWASFPISAEYRSKMGSAAYASGIHIEHQQLDTTIEKNAHLTGKATTSFMSQGNGLRVVPFDLFGTLRVQSVKSQDGQPLSFIQEDKDDDPGFYVILTKPLSRGDKYAITTSYSGKDAIKNEGEGNYYPIAREDWFPASEHSGLGDYAMFDMTFRIPKGLKMAASGELVTESMDGNSSVTVWKSDAPQPTAGFQFGRMKEDDAKLTNLDFMVAAFANEEPPDWARTLEGGHNGTLNTVNMMQQPLAEAQFAIGLYTNYFGQLPFKRLNIAQQTACGYGQSWPGLVWLPICAFYDVTVRHNLGLDLQDNIYWDVVTPHEVAHQWWGQMVGFRSYRDQWMSEGFADFSASLFLQHAYGNKSTKKFIDFWDYQRKTIVERNKYGFRPIDVGPVTMGYRLDNTKVGGNIAQALIYPKGSYILHMIRMMMYNNQTKDENFKGTMHDFTSTFSGRVATTEDFKATVEKHMTAEMQRIGDGKMDWFFNEYVYGTALPTYKLDSTFDKNADGDVVFGFKIMQSGVDDKFRMLVPLYLELANGNVMFLGHVGLVGNTSTEAKVPLTGMKDTPHRAMLNYYDDVLASVN